jgi:hypothetical protein
VSPILVRPVREQLEHDRLIRFLLLNKYKRKFEANGNTGDEHQASVKIGTAVFFPDIVLSDGKKLLGIVEVETGESVNNLEALAQWVHFAKARTPFHLYVPVASIDSARRLCETHHLQPTEVWSYRGAMDGFDLVRVSHNPTSTGTLRVELTPKAPPVKPAPPVVEPPVVDVKDVKATKPGKPEKDRPADKLARIGKGEVAPVAKDVKVDVKKSVKTPPTQAAPVTAVAKGALPAKTAPKPTVPVKPAPKSAVPVKAAPKSAAPVKPAPKSAKPAKPVKAAKRSAKPAPKTKAASGTKGSSKGKKKR